MGNIGEFVHYWVENVKETRERHEWLEWLLAAVLGGGSWIFHLHHQEGVEGKIAFWIGISVLVWAVLWLPFKRHQVQEHEYKKLEESIKPKLKLSCGTTVPGSRIQTTATTTYQQYDHGVPTESGEYQEQALWHRLVLEADGASVVNCCGVLKEVAKGEKVIMENETFDLKFASGEGDNERKKTIYSGIKAYLDVLGTFQHSGLRITTPGWRAPASVDQVKLFKEPGIYSLKVVIGCDNAASTEANLEFNWTGKWDTAELRMKSSRLLLPSLKRGGA